MRKINIQKSLALWKRAEKAIPAGTQLLSKSPRAYVFGAYPIFIDHARGSHVWDVDGNEYIDYMMGYGPNILGYGYPAVRRAVEKQLNKWTAFSLLNTPMVEAAELLIKYVPCAEMVRFGKHGSDVTSMAVRAARSFTGREKIATCGYHGWQDWYVASSHLDTGVPKALKNLIFLYRYNDLASLEKIFWQNKNQIAGVTLELMEEGNYPTKDFLEGINKLAHDNGALVIYDEVVTGFRFGLGGAQKYFGVTPDLACFGKAISNGLALSALVGKRKYMQVFDYNKTFFSSTFGDEVLPLAAAIATIKVFENKPVVKHLWQVGRKLQDGINKLAGKYNLPVEAHGSPVTFVLTYKLPKENDRLILKSLVLQEGAKRGVLYGLTQMVSYSHSVEDINKTLRVTDEVFAILKKAIDSGHPEKFLEGKPHEPVRL